MAIVLQKHNGYYHIINGAIYLKGSVIVMAGQFGEWFTLMRDGSPLIDTAHWTDFVDGDDSDAPFASIELLTEYFDKVFNLIYPVTVPHCLITEDLTTDVLVKEGKCMIHSITIVNKRNDVAYIRVFDTNATPTALDIPVLVYPIISQTEDVPVNLLTVPLVLYKGFGYSITSSVIEEGEEVEPGANEIVLNAIYQ